ncbi:hypothetical protein [uncultured Thiothrix sp.]|uniref:hypothetical protein n=1 Tax=uncultured Thiothrix sp. TaxID=223185 RepID=UPI00263379D0|nr:hypothetical protein [uncultured Thiothrix sp.]
MFMYESKSQQPVTRAKFVQRIGVHSLLVALIVAGSLGLGIAGYMYFENLSAMDAFLNAAMLLGGMGPVNPPLTQAGKLFAGLYALYAGLVFIATAALLFTPFLHRILHKFHWDLKD